MVALPIDVEEVYLGENGIFSIEGSCQIVVDMTTSRPILAQTIARTAEERGINSLDAPVSGGDIGARNATLAIMVGGKKEVFEWEVREQDSTQKCATRSLLPEP
jgi:3-hydroxyisobutyrate dehydrogenase